MTRKTTNRLKTLAAAGALCLTAAAVAAQPVEIIYSDTVQETDRRSRILSEVFSSCLGEGFEFKPYFGATLMKQGTDPAGASVKLPSELSSDGHTLASPVELDTCTSRL